MSGLSPEDEALIREGLSLPLSESSEQSLGAAEAQTSSGEEASPADSPNLGPPEASSPEDDTNPEVEAPEPERPLATLLALDPSEPLTETEEQALRDYFGYAPSEKRTRAEREAMAKRISERPGFQEALAWAKEIWFGQAREMEAERRKKREEAKLPPDHEQRKARERP